jgi:hypothetical protein
MTNNIGIAAVLCSGAMWYAYATGVIPILYVALAAIALLSFMAFAGSATVKKKTPTSDKYLGPDEPISPYR